MSNTEETIMKLKWEVLTKDLESRARAVRASESAKTLKQEVEEAIAEVEPDRAPPDIINRLDQLLLTLTEASRDNVCTNTKCPHYNKRCRMR